MRLSRYLFLREPLVFSLLESEVGSGKTITAKVALVSEGDPADIGSLTQTATASGGTYLLTFSRTSLQTDLATMINRKVYLHLDDGVVWHAVFPHKVTDTDPDILPPLLD